jgi:hypothetical protein
LRHLNIGVDDFQSGVGENGSVCIDVSPHYTYTVVEIDKEELLLIPYSKAHRFWVPVFDYIKLIKTLTKFVSLDGECRFQKLVFVKNGEKLGAYFISLKEKK